MWILTIKQFRDTSSGYEIDYDVNYEFEDVTKMLQIIELLCNTDTKKTSYLITKKEEA